ncbi:hypothetical protein NIES4102_34750 [Chondrocystis sp. NIES-4102]|nr:hypothetical protein NIES4102_34750 [Chondrocystis sp. NIES-4102]
MLKQRNTLPRILISLIVAGCVYVFLPSSTFLVSRLIMSWDAGVICLLVLIGKMIIHATPEKMRRNAQILDENRLTILILFVAAACASLMAIAYILKHSQGLLGWQLTLHISLAIATIIVSWVLIHTSFAIHYAHLYYKNSTKENIAGLDFPQEPLPDYWDFLYFSFIIGMTCQVSDVAISTRPMRRLALFHGILTFFFNTVIVALSVNIIAGLK